MFKFFIPLCLLLSACHQVPQRSTDPVGMQPDEYTPSIENALAAGDITVEKLYLKPDLETGRWFKVTDQYGCMWWINSGHKFDRQQLDVFENGKPNCPDEKLAPPPHEIYRDRKGEVIDPYSYAPN